jgi:hypothetical protein
MWKKLPRKRFGTIAKILYVPEEYDIVCVLPVGVAEDEPSAPKKKSFDERAWFNTFNGEE